MAVDNAELLTPAEAAAVADVPLKAVYKAVAERLPRMSLVRRSGQAYLTAGAVVCVRLDHQLPRHVPVKVRRSIYAKLRTGSAGSIAYETKLLRYVVDSRPVYRTVAAGLRRYRNARRLIVEDPDVQGGAATLRGTRILVHQVVGLLQQGITEDELRQDYPRLTPAMIQAARIYAQAHPRRGRPRQPDWRKARPLASHVVPGRAT